MKGQEALAALWSALDEGYEPPPPNSITAYTYAEKYGIGPRQSRDRLNAEVKAGRLESGIFNVGGKLVKYYWLPKGKRK